MNNQIFKIKSKAIKDMEVIFDYIHKENPSSAKNLINEFYELFKKLAKFPNIGSTKKFITYKNVRFYVIKNHFLVVYNITDNCVTILRVLSSYQDICKLI